MFCARNFSFVSEGWKFLLSRHTIISGYGGKQWSARILYHVKIDHHVIDKSPPIKPAEFDGRAHSVRARAINSEDLNVLRDTE